MNSVQRYFSSFFKGLGSLLKGMRITFIEFFTKKITEKYPENRATLKISDRFRGELIMLHNENNEHHCVACGKRKCCGVIYTTTAVACTANSASGLALTTPLILFRHLNMPYLPGRN